MSINDNAIRDVETLSDCPTPYLKVPFINCMLTLLVMPLTGLHFCVGLDM
jgi:hypothetical protein